jgi:hypothetical protein
MRRLIPSAVRCAALAAAVHLSSPAAAQQVPPAAESRRITICVLRDGMPVNVEAAYDSASGDTLLDGQPFSRVHAAEARPYAAGSEWYINGEMLPFHGWRLAKSGLPRVIQPDLLQRAGEFRGIPLFGEAGVSGIPDVVYVPVRPGCVFHAYQMEYHVGAVRGGR